LKCEALSIKKYLDTSPNIFFIYGSEVILKNNSKDILKNHLKKKGFTERKFINKDGFKDIEQAVMKMQVVLYLAQKQ